MKFVQIIHASEYGDADIASDADNDHHDNVNLDETLILDDSDFFYSEIDKIDFIENHFDLEPIADVYFTFKECA